jgi:aspartate aminotransferase-like enzyme
VTAIVTPEGVTPQAVVRGVAAHGYTIGGGYGKVKSSTVRIGHMGDHTVAGLDGCLDACGEVLRALTA